MTSRKQMIAVIANFTLDAIILRNAIIFLTGHHTFNWSKVEKQHKLEISTSIWKAILWGLDPCHLTLPITLASGLDGFYLCIQNST